MSFCGTRQQKTPPQKKLGQEAISCGATRLDVMFHAHSSRTDMRRPFSRRVCSGAHTRGFSPFRLPSEVHSSLRSPPRSHHPRLSEGKEARLTHSSSTVYGIVAHGKTIVKRWWTFCGTKTSPPRRGRFYQMLPPRPLPPPLPRLLLPPPPPPEELLCFRTRVTLL